MIIEDTKKEEIIDEDLDNKDTQKHNFETVKETTNSHHWITVSGIFLGIFLILILIIFGIFSFYNHLNQATIAKGISIYGFDISGMTKKQATEKLDNYFSSLLSNDITLIYNDYTTYIKTSEIGLSFDVDSAVDYAYQYGKNSNIFVDNLHVFSTMLNGLDIMPQVKYEQDFLETILNSLSSELPDAIVESAYYIENNDLIITKGKSGSVVDVDSTASIIKEKLSDLSYLNETIEIKTKNQSPKEIDLDSIHNEIYSEAKDAYYTTNPYAVYPSSNGVDFKISIDEAKALLETADSECTIPLKTLYPNVTTNMIGEEAFPDSLATFSTKYATSNRDRTTNLRLAASKIDGYVLLPGETFSYNTVVGERTIAAGYKEAAIYQNGEVVQGLGGGICQISTTLYNAILFANLEIVELYNHQFVPSYVTAGRDATVVYGVKDFKFKNTRNYPIKINCSVADGIARFEIKGLKQENEYEVSVYANVTSRTSSYIKSSTYRTLKQNGQVVSTENIINSTYKVH